MWRWRTSPSRTFYRSGEFILAVLFFFHHNRPHNRGAGRTAGRRLREREARIRALNRPRRTALPRTSYARRLRQPRSFAASSRASDDPALQADIVRRIGQRLDGLREMIDDLLDFAASREATLAAQPLAPVDLGAALDSAIERERPIADEKGITLRTPPRPSVRVMAGDPGLGMVLGNVLNNAIKYTPPGGSVTVQVEVDHGAGQAAVSVQDTGIGIPSRDLPHIFDEFYRASIAKNAQIVGTGIGLAAVRAMVEYYGGTSPRQRRGRGRASPCGCRWRTGSSKIIYRNEWYMRRTAHAPIVAFIAFDRLTGAAKNRGGHATAPVRVRAVKGPYARPSNVSRSPTVTRSSRLGGASIR